MTTSEPQPPAEPGTPPRLLPEYLRGDVSCSACATRENIRWSTPAPVWNAVVRNAEASPWRDNEPILCVTCFVILCDQVGLRPTGWLLTPEWPWVYAESYRHVDQPIMHSELLKAARDVVREGPFPGFADLQRLATEVAKWD